MGCIGADACPMPEGEKWLSYVARCKADRSKPWSMTAVTIKTIVVIKSDYMLETLSIQGY